MPPRARSRLGRKIARKPPSRRRLGKGRKRGGEWVAKKREAEAEAEADVVVSLAHTHTHTLRSEQTHQSQGNPEKSRAACDRERKITQHATSRVRDESESTNSGAAEKVQ